jgi:hypothetical protein
MKTLLRYSACILILLIVPLCAAQSLTIRVINAKDGRPLQRQRVSVTLLYDRGEAQPAKYDATLALETDAEGKAQFSLPEPAPRHLAVRVTVDWGHWNCGCGVLTATQDVIEKGVVESAANRKDSAAPTTAPPGEILFVARPLSFFQRLMYPFLKG